MLHVSEPVKSHICYHCGDTCKDSSISINEKLFCCDGCKLVFELLSNNNLCTYYDLEQNPGASQKVTILPGKFEYLDNIDISNKLIHFKQGKQSHTTLYLPQMHCSSCIWLLEHLQKLDNGILESRTNFPEKKVTIIFNEEQTSLRKIVELLTGIGYEPHINLDTLNNSGKKPINKKRILRLGVAGFCFGNIMMLSFPEYFSLGANADLTLKQTFSYLNLMLALPVFFYSAGEFFASSWASIKQKKLNIDAPIALAIVITFARSVYEILSHTGAGYLDSMTGIVFFMLIGRYFQDKTYDSISFERDYRSFFPVSVSKITNGVKKSIAVENIDINDNIIIHHEEIIPVDTILIKGNARIDYSFVSGEAQPVHIKPGEIIYAGGKQTQGAIELRVVKKISQSYLTQLWNKDVFSEKHDKQTSFVHSISKYFTIALFSIAFISFLYWQLTDPSKSLNAVTAVLVVACPCSLLLSATFTNGNILRLLSKRKYYLKNNLVVETLAKADHIVFDKTGTITHAGENSIAYHGEQLTEIQKQHINSLCSQSNHPLSVGISRFLDIRQNTRINDFKETASNGISGSIDNVEYKIGSAGFTNWNKPNMIYKETRVYITGNGRSFGYFSFQNKFREGLYELISKLKTKYKISVISGDNDASKREINFYFGYNSTILFDQRPEDKLNFIKSLQQKGETVVMIGDGLNDAGALKQSDVGIAISDNCNNFTPGCDAIVNGDNFSKLNNFFAYCGSAKQIIVASFIISILYNCIGLYYATQALLQPVIAAILMPASSISIVLFATIASYLSARKNKI